MVANRCQCLLINSIISDKNILAEVGMSLRNIQLQYYMGGWKGTLYSEEQFIM